MMIPRSTRPICRDCGDERGPWRPAEGFRDERGGQVFVCAPGHGCASLPPATESDRCAPFCDNKELHAVDPDADDYGCLSVDYSTALNSMPWVMCFPIIVDVGAHRAKDGNSKIEFTARSTGHYRGTSLELTTAEARRIAHHLLTVADLVDEANGVVHLSTAVENHVIEHAAVEAYVKSLPGEGVR
ncbi:hypothetical protein [Nocardia arizonensis]|uniref:hypothetical protein n=1 Tax=Nocardia arizonensis TaxID=1141647 RepID=UPI0006CF7629|nr:hypothetical protein [Nocardia arizonensis]